MKRSLFIVIQLLIVVSYAFSQEKIGELKSPDEKINVELTKDSNGSIFYKVYRENVLLINDSKLSISTSAKSLANCTYESTIYNNINESFQLVSGKTHIYKNHCNELTAKFTYNTGEINVIFRAYNDGVAFRYNLIDNKVTWITVRSETSEININNYLKSWAQKFTASEDYSEHYTLWENWSEIANQRTLYAPVLVEETNGNHLLMTEANNDQNYAASKFIATEKEGMFTLDKVGTIKSTLPFLSPWRVIMLGDIKTIMQSSIVDYLNPPTNIQDFSWIKPGRVSWSWGGDDASAEAASDFSIIKKYIDLAHNMNWEYSLLDEGWEYSKADYTLQEAIEYANEKNVGLFVWAGSGKFKADEEQIRGILKPWKDAGVKGVKLDFFNSDEQSMMDKYEKLFKVTSELELILNLHGCTKPSGRVRTWPHLLTTEAVYGGENYLHNSNVTPANHNIILTMTRNILGSMDYTPGDFGTNKGQVRQLTTWAHQMALLTAYESALQHFVDCPENYNYHIGEGYFKILPVTWDEFKVFEAMPEKYVTIGRKNGSDWYIAALCDEARTLNLSLDFLEDGKKYYAYIYKDGTCKTDIAFEYKEDINKNSSLSIPMKVTGGATIHISTSPGFFKPEVKLYEAEAFAGSNLAVWTDDKKLCSGNKFVGNIGMGKSIKFNKVIAPTSGKYALTFFYMSGDKRDAYIKVNEKTTTIQQLTFNATEGYDGKGLGVKTIIVDLEEGNNTIEFGNETGYAPNLDRIVVQQALKDSSGEGNSILPVQENSEFKIQSSKDGININCKTPFTYKVYAITGHIVASGDIIQENSFIPIKEKGIYLVRLYSTNIEYTEKVIIP